MKFKPLLAVTAASVGAKAFAGPALAAPLSGDTAILDGSQFRLNVNTLEPGCYNGSGLAHVHVDVDNTAQEAHISVRKGASYSVDQVLIPSRIDGYTVHNMFNTGGGARTDGAIDPDQTGTDLGTSDGSKIAAGDIVVCVTDHLAPNANEPYMQQDGGLVSAKNRPVFQPMLSCLGASAIEPLNTYKAGFGYSPAAAGYNPVGVTDPNAVDFNGDGIADAVRINPREDSGIFDARRVNDFDSAGEAFSDDLANYGQTRLFLLAGDSTAWTLSNNDDPDTLANLITFTAQGDLPLTWTLRASLAGPGSKKSYTLTDDALRAWEASWQAYYRGGMKPTMALCPGTNSPAPSTTVVVNLPQQTMPVAGTNTVTTRDITTVQTVAGATVVKHVAAKRAKVSRKAACICARRRPSTAPPAARRSGGAAAGSTRSVHNRLRPSGPGVWGAAFGRPRCVSPATAVSRRC